MFYATSLNLFMAVRRRIPDKSSPIVAMLNSFFHLISAPSVVLLPLMLLSGRWRAAVRLFNPALYFWSYYGGMISRRFRPTSDPAASIAANRAEGEVPLSLLTFNIHAEEAHLAPMVDVIRAAGADVVTLQEVSFPAAEYCARALAADYPHQALHPNGYASAGQAVFSKFPIRADAYWRNEAIPNALGHQRVVLDIAGREIVVYNAHPVHPGMVGPKFNARPRDYEVSDLLRRAHAETLPVIIMGDLNLTDQSNDYARLASRYADAFREVGRGMGFTFPDWRASNARGFPTSHHLFFVPPFMRLDYVFHDRTFRALEARVINDATGSDHRPLFVRLALSTGAAAAIPHQTPMTQKNISLNG